MENQTERPARTIITQQELTEGMREGRFMDAEVYPTLLFQDFEFKNKDGEELRLDLEHPPRTLGSILFRNCSFPDNFVVINGEKQDLNSIQITGCNGRNFEISTLTNRLEVSHSELRNLVLHKISSKQTNLIFDNSSISYLDGRINTPRSVLTLTAEKTQFHTIEIIAPELTTKDIGRLHISFEPFAADYEDLDQPILEVSSRVITNIPQVARFFRLLCPTTPVLFVGDMRELLRRVKS